MTKIIEINNCVQCPHHGFKDYSILYRCNKEHRDLPKQLSNAKIPSWCPLEDKKEVSK